MQPLVSKFSEKVLFTDLQEMYLLVAECVGPQSVASRISVAVEKTTSPAVLQNAYTFLTRLISEFSKTNKAVAKMFHVHKLIDLAISKKVGLGHRLPKVKDSAEAMIMEVCRCSSDPGGMNSVLPMLKDVTPKRLAAMTLKMARIAEEATAGGAAGEAAGTGRAVKQAVGNQENTTGTATTAALPTAAAASAATVAAAVPGVDLTSQLPASLLKQMETEEGKTAWKQRMGAIDAATKVLTNVYGVAGVVLFNRSIHDLIQALKKRMSDSNVKVAEKSITLVGLIATKVGEPIARCSKIIVQPLLKLLLGNKKKAVLKAREVLDQWVTAGSGGESPTTSVAVIDSCLPFMADALGQFVKGKKSAACGEMLEFTVKHVGASSAVTVEHMETMVPDVLFCLGDKSKLTRDNAERVLTSLATRVNEDVVRTALGNIKGQHGKNIAPVVNQILIHNVSVSAAAAAANSGTAKTAKTTKTTKIKRTKINTKSTKKDTATQQEHDNDDDDDHNKGTKSSTVNKGKVHGEAQKVNKKGDGGSSDDGMLFLLTEPRDKTKRARFDQKNKWVRSDDPKTQKDNDVVRQLHDQLESVVSPSLYTSMYPTSKNDATCARSICLACQTIMDTIEEELVRGPHSVVLDGMVSSLDLILKWMTLHVDTNKAQVIGALLECLSSILNMMRVKSMSMSLYEMGIIYPFCTLLVGHKNARMKALFRSIMLLLAQQVPPKELCPMLLHGIDANILKNSKSRVQNIEEMGRIIGDVGHRQFFTSSKQIVSVAQNLDDRAGDVSL